jgi:hypothetical protein
VLFAGLLAGATLLYRLDLVFAVALPLALVWFGLDPTARRRLVLWTLVGVSPYLVHLVWAGPRNVIDGMIIEPVFDLRGGRRLPLPQRIQDDWDGFLQGASELNRAPWPFPSPRGQAQLAIWVFLLVAAVALLVLAGIVVLRGRGERRLLAIALLCVGMLPQALQRADSTHLAWVSCVPFGVLPVALVELVRAWRRDHSFGGRRLLAGAIAVPVLLTFFAIPYFTWRTYGEATAQTLGRRRLEKVIEHDGRRFPYNRIDAVDAVRELLPVVERTTEPGDTLIVAPGDLRKTPYSEAFLYHLLPDLVPGTRYIEMDPGVANAHGSELADELRAADVLIMSTIRDDWNEPNDSRLYGPNEPNEVVEDEYCLEGRFGDGPFDPERGLYELYLRC